MPLTYRDAVQRMAEDYKAVFGGRDAELTELDTFLAQEEKPYALLLAPTGRGKTALLIHWVARVQADAQWTVIFAPISIRYQTASEGATFSALAHALGAFYGESEQIRTYNQTPEQLRGLVADYLGRPLRDDRRLLLVLDGLDEAVNWRMSRDLFPRTPSPHLRIVAAAREMARTSRDDWLETLGWRARQTWALTLSELSREAVIDVLRRMGDPLHRLSASTDLPTEIARVSEGDPLTIRLLVEALHDGTLTPSTLTRLPPGLEAYVRNWLIELEARGEQNPAVYTLLGLCAVALGPLTDVDIQRLAPDVFVRKISLNQAVGSVARFIIGDGSGASGYVFSHARLREIFLEKELSSDEQEQFRHRFVTYGQAWYERRTRPLSTYLRLFWIAHLANADMWDVVRRVVTEVVPVGEKYEQPWAAARYAVEGSYAGYLSDLDILWRWADRQGNLTVGLRCALISSSIRALIGHFPPSLWVGLVKVGTPAGRWSIAATLEHVRQISDSPDRSDALEALAQSDCELPLDLALDVARTITHMRAYPLALIALLPRLQASQKIEVYNEALVAIHDITYDPWHLEVLIKLLPHTASTQRPEIVAEALAVARSTDRRSDHAECLVELMPYLSTPLRDEICAEILTIARTDLRDWETPKKVKILTLLAPHLPSIQRDEIYREVLTLSGSLKSHFGPGFDERREALVALASNLPIELFSDFFDILSTIDHRLSEIDPVEALITFAHRMPIDKQPAIFSEALAAARRISYDWSRAEALTRVVPHLPTAQQPEICEEALNAARKVDFLDWRAEALSDLAPCFMPAQQPEIYAEALAAASGIGDENERAEVLTVLIPHVAVEQQAAVYNESLAAACAITDAENIRSRTFRLIDRGPWRAAHLRIPVPDLPPEILMETLAYARSITAKDWRARHLMALASYFTPEQQIEIYREALTVALTIHDNDAQSAVLTAFAAHLPSTILREAIVTVRDATNRHTSVLDWRAKVLEALVPHLPADLFSDALAILREAIVTVRDATNGHTSVFEWAKVLEALVPHLPADLFSDALAIARTIPDDFWRWIVLAELAAHFSSAQNFNCADMFCAARPNKTSISHDAWIWNRVLAALVPHLPADLFSDALAIARTIPDLEVRAIALAIIAPYLPAGQQSQVYAEALVAARTIQEDTRRAGALTTLAPWLPPAQQREVYAEALLDATHIMFLDDIRTSRLSALSPLLANWSSTSPANHSTVLRLWGGSVRDLSTYGRPDFLIDLASMMVWLAELIKAEELIEVATALVDVSHSWP